jgi:dihydropyrimidine dehydrogenase (NAD+) subunit PreT
MFTELRPPIEEEEMLLEADRCLDCGRVHATAPCLAACPAEVDVPRFVAQLAAGNTDAAADTIFAANILGATCARVCPVEVLCQGACVLERPIEIGRLQRFATDAALARRRPLRRVRRPDRRTGEVAVVGAGPAGLACAGELAALGHRVTVYDERAEVGGLVRYAIAPYRQQSEPLPDELRALEELGVRVELGTRLRSRRAFERLLARVDAVFLGVGLGADADAPVEGDTLVGVWESLPFIEAIKSGSPPEVGGRVAVVGGGNTAIDAARLAVRLGAAEVTLLYRRTRAEMPAYDHEVAEAEEEGVAFRWLVAPNRFLGTTRLTGVELQEMRLREPDASGRRGVEPVPDSTSVIAADTVVKALGQRPRAELAEWIDGIELERGKIVADAETGRTGNPRVFAGGDAVNGGAGVVQAVRDAKLAARAIDELVASC